MRDRHAERQKYRQTDIQTDRQIDTSLMYYINLYSYMEAYEYNDSTV